MTSAVGILFMCIHFNRALNNTNPNSSIPLKTAIKMVALTWIFCIGYRIPWEIVTAVTLSPEGKYFGGYCTMKNFSTPAFVDPPNLPQIIRNFQSINSTIILLLIIAVIIVQLFTIFKLKKLIKSVQPTSSNIDINPAMVNGALNAIGRSSSSSSHRHQIFVLPRRGTTSLSTTSTTCRPMKHQRRALKLLLFISGTYACIMFPVMMVHLINNVCQTCIPTKVYLILLRCGALQPFANPVIFFLKDRRFRTALKLMFCRIRRIQ